MKTSFLGKLRNIGILILTVVVYLFLAAAIQLGFHVPALVSTFIADVIICVICAVLYFNFRKDTFPENESFKSKDIPSIKQVVLYFLYFVAITLLITLVFTWFNLHFTDPAMDQREVTISKSDLILYIMLSCFIAPVQEEFMNRLFLYNMMKTKFHWLTSAIITSLVFGFLHGTIGHMIFGSLFGFILALSYERTKVWLIPILGHMTYNMSLFVMPANEITALSSIDGVVIFAAVVLAINLVGQIVYVTTRKEKTEATISI